MLDKESTHKINLTKEALKDMKQIGSVTSSSKFLTNRILKEIDFKKNISILELGAGNGIFTYEILKKMSNNSRFVCYENYEKFTIQLSKIKDERFHLKGESVEKLHLLETGSFDYVISSLPLANFSKNFKTKLFKTINKILKTEGKLVQYQYLLLDYNTVKKEFKECKIGFCLRNIPPAFLYIAKK